MSSERLKDRVGNLREDARILPFRPRDEGETPLRRRAVPRFDDATPSVAAGDAGPRPGAGDTVPRRGQDAAPHRQAEVTPLRRHRGARIRHSRRSLLLRLAKPFLLAVAIVAGPLVLSIWIFRSPVFALADLDISSDGGGRVSESWVRETLQPVRGWNLPRLPLPWVDAVLKRNSWVQATALRKELPNRLSVQVIERREVALLSSAGDADLWYLDTSGKKIAPYQVSDGEIDLPLVTAESPDADLRGALALLGEIEDTALYDTVPGWAAGLSEIEVLGEQDFRVWSASLPFPLLVRLGTLARKISYLEELLPEIGRRYEAVDAVDLRFAKKIILQPAVRSSGRKAPGVQKRGLGR